MEPITLIGVVALIVAIVRNLIGAYKDWREISKRKQKPTKDDDRRTRESSHD